MANVLSGNVWKLDTAGGGVLKTGWIKIKYIVWYDPTAANDTFALQDVDNKDILVGIAQAIAQSQTYNLEGWYHGLNLTQLSSGRIEIHIL